MGLKRIKKPTNSKLR